MCWISSKLTPTIITSPLKVYKIGILKQGFTSLVQLFEYEPHKVYRSEIKAELIYNSIRVYEAFHSYSGDVKLSICDSYITISYNNIFITDIERVSNLCVAEFTIPKYSHVDTNQRGEIISDYIMLNKVKSITSNKTFKQIFDEN